jgi:hypothetical protein
MLLGFVKACLFVAAEREARACDRVRIHTREVHDV